MTKSNNLDFTGTKIFCGLDVHLKNWRVNIRDQEMELRDFSPFLVQACQFKRKPGANVPDWQPKNFNH